MPSLSIVVASMNRLAQAKVFIPTAASAIGAADEIVLVDADDPENVSSWALSLKEPKLTIVQVKPLTWFEPNRLRNIGIRNAVGDLVIVSDIDFLMPQQLLTQCRALELNHFLVQPSVIGSYGWLCMWWTDWRRVNGYEEALSGYGYDDFYMRDSLNQSGLKMVLAESRCAPIGAGTNARSYPDDKQTTTHHVNMRLGKALRILHNFRGNHARNFGWGGEVLQRSEARNNAGETRSQLSRTWWRG